MSTLEELAAQAYDAYGEHAGWQTFDGRPMPRTWAELNEPVREHWKAAVDAVADWQAAS